MDQESVTVEAIQLFLGNTINKQSTSEDYRNKAERQSNEKQIPKNKWDVTPEKR